jgi:hypothetical protein
LTPARSDQDHFFDALAAVLEDLRAALPVGNPVRHHRRSGREQFLHDDVAFERRPLVSAVFLRPRHAEVAARAALDAERAVGRSHGADGGHEASFGPFLVEKGAHLGPEACGRGRHGDRREAKLRHLGLAPGLSLCLDLS